MASSCIASCIFHIISIPFNCSDAALRITDGKIGPKVMFALFPEFGARTLSHLGNRAEISHMNARQNSSR